MHNTNALFMQMQQCNFPARNIVRRAAFEVLEALGMGR